MPCFLPSVNFSYHLKRVISIWNKEPASFMHFFISVIAPEGTPHHVPLFDVFRKWWQIKSCDYCSTSILWNTHSKLLELQDLQRTNSVTATVNNLLWLVVVKIPWCITWERVFRQMPISVGQYTLCKWLKFNVLPDNRGKADLSNHLIPPRSLNFIKLLIWVHMVSM